MLVFEFQNSIKSQLVTCHPYRYTYGLGTNALATRNKHWVAKKKINFQQPNALATQCFSKSGSKRGFKRGSKMEMGKMKESKVGCLFMQCCAYLA